jgi:glycerol 2-dehydrogenase (NADP+)
MQKLVGTGKTRAVGISNFSITDIKALLPHQDDAPISCNQVEVHPWLPQIELIEFHKEHDILTTCYSPFAGQKKDGATLVKDETVLKVAKECGLEAGQLLQSWAIQRGTIPLGKSATESRIKSNLNVQKLSEEHVKALDKLEIPNGKGRTIMKPWGVKMFSN